MSFKSIVPNLITLMNLTSGLFALLFVINQEYYFAFYAVCLGILFDFFDGFAARLLNVSSNLGLQLDSLADMVTSGVVPGLIMFFMLGDTVGVTIDAYANWTFYNWILWVPVIGFIITLGSCYRLAKFNIDERQTDSFIGLPTPANCLFIAGLPILILENKVELITHLLSNTWVLIMISGLSAYILNSEVHLFSLKIKGGAWTKYILQIVYLFLCVCSIAFFQVYAVPFLILLYVLVSLVAPSNKLSSK